MMPPGEGGTVATRQISQAMRRKVMRFATKKKLEQGDDSTQNHPALAIPACRQRRKR
jgi:hypothetical protein